MKFKTIKVCFGLVFAATTLAALGGIHDEPDGVSIQVADDGSYKVISIGTGTYDFNDPDDILDARKEAERNAKAAIAKFFSESLATEESATAQMSKVKKMNSDGKTSTASVSKNSAKETLSAIRSSAKKLLTGVVVLEDEKVPSGNGGTYRVMVGVSSTTIGAATALSNGMAESQAAQGAPTVAASAATGEATAPAASESAGGARSAEAVPATGLPPVPEGGTVCIGMGSERKDAVQAALVEGISQVYGQLIASVLSMALFATAQDAGLAAAARKLYQYVDGKMYYVVLGVPQSGVSVSVPPVSQMAVKAPAPSALVESAAVPPVPSAKQGTVTTPAPTARLNNQESAEQVSSKSIADGESNKTITDDEILARLRSRLMKNPEDFNIRIRMARVFERQGNTRRALRNYSDAARLIALDKGNDLEKKIEALVEVAEYEESHFAGALALKHYRVLRRMGSPIANGRIARLLLRFQ